jgi:hypothetical protein
MECAPQPLQVGRELGIGKEFPGVDSRYDAHGPQVSHLAQAIRFAADLFAELEDGGKDWHDPGNSISSARRLEGTPEINRGLNKELRCCSGVKN